MIKNRVCDTLIYYIILSFLWLKISHDEAMKIDEMLKSIVLMKSLQMINHKTEIDRQLKIQTHDLISYESNLL